MLTKDMVYLVGVLVSELQVDFRTAGAKIRVIRAALLHSPTRIDRGLRAGSS
jgi:hypothetical protein